MLSRETALAFLDEMEKVSAIKDGEEVADAEGDWGTPFRMKENHLHEGGKEGIHFKGTLAEARAELAKAREGKSLLKTAAYSEGATSTFSHEKRRYSVDKTIAATQQKAVRQVPVKDLEWILKYTKPDAGRTRTADTDVPVLATKYGDKLVVVDGLHRLAKARAEGRETLPVRYVARADLRKAFIEKKAEYAKGLPDKKKTSPVRLIEKPEHWRMVTQSHPATRAGQHTDLRLTDPAPGGISHSWATKKDWPKAGERIRLFQQPDHKPSYSDFQGHLLSGYGKTKPGSKGVQKVMDERVEIKRTSDKLIRFDVFRKEGELPDRYVLVKAKHDGKGHPPWVLINHGKAKADQVPVK